MREIDLHNLWKSKSIPVSNLFLTSGEPVSILNFGFYNERESGPDFSFGMIHLDGVDLVGPIEIHVKSSDWYRHNHQFDPAYDNVIVHVVYNHDKDIYQNGRKLPTIELSRFIKINESSGLHNEIVCKHMLGSVPVEHIEQAKMEALELKYASKTAWLQAQGITYHFESELYLLLASYFGGEVNREPFLRLIEKVPFESLINLSSAERFDLLLQTSELTLPRSDRVEFKWKYKGLRPAGFPEKRVPQFCAIVSNLLFDEGFIKFCLDLEIKNIRSLLKSPDCGQTLSIGQVNGVIMNCLLPLMQSKRMRRMIALTEIRDILLDLPAESNHIIDKWKQTVMTIKNGYDSQALNALYRYQCSDKKCLSCAIGRSTLN